MDLQISASSLYRKEHGKAQEVLKISVRSTLKATPCPSDQAIQRPASFSLNSFSIFAPATDFPCNLLATSSVK